MKDSIKGGNVKEEVSMDAMKSLLNVLNSTPKNIKLADKEFAITPLKNGTMYLIAAEAHKIKSIDKENTESILLNMAKSLPVMCRVVALAILNDKSKIEGDEYKELVDFIMWQTSHKEFDKIFLEILSMLDLQFFFASTKQISMFLQNVAHRKKTMEEAT